MCNRDSHNTAATHHTHGALEVPAQFITRRNFVMAAGMGLGAFLLSACAGNDGSQSESTTSNGPTVPPSSTTSMTTSTSTHPSSGSLAGFDQFSDTVKVTREGEWWLIESNGLPAHDMMVGIRSWQQQVPTPQPYSGANAWRIPVEPTVAKSPVSARTALYRGAIALAANGVPIFNALNNRGEDAYLAGELDKWGGHAGRADDYHYHVAPLHLQKNVGANRPIAFALDGYPIYGETEPDGSKVRSLDEFNGHTMPDGSYHYHGTTTYPYINGGLRGRISVVGDQVDPQPVTRPFREATSPLQGATIVSFSAGPRQSYSLEYSVDGATGQIAYTVTTDRVNFTFTAPDGTVTTETYVRRP